MSELTFKLMGEYTYSSDAILAVPARYTLPALLDELPVPAAERYTLVVEDSDGETYQGMLELGTCYSEPYWIWNGCELGFTATYAPNSNELTIETRAGCTLQRMSFIVSFDEFSSSTQRALLKRKVNALDSIVNLELLRKEAIELGQLALNYQRALQANEQLNGLVRTDMSAVRDRLDKLLASLE